MQEHRFPTSRTARYFTLGTHRRDVRQVWFVCHGYGQLAQQFLRQFEVLDDGRRLIVAPEGLSRYYIDHTDRRVGASWMTSEDRLSEISDYVDYLDALYEHVLKRHRRSSVDVYVLGFSQGAATAARWISHGSATTDRLILWAA
ncbi:MAG: phospholipase, partial [Gemmatimonadales bacterium]|nr:phospholipase [Gemmatimonadales bacterium]NIN10211.1 phospholipase [Gemmatimonadales bacterium]NIN48967.1 phospholipase [Gemmatimonadales bacterium]NIP06431.1 phospholipase [Gemmatimonadales bacterium]NIQ98783.1 phospholipase [Gemmatimonadales bacterium]